MNPDHFERFNRLIGLGKRAGNRSEAAVALREFLASFSNFDEKRIWTEDYLAHHDAEKKVRHELYEHIIFPVLLEGYRRSEPWSLRWLARTSQNLHRAEHLWHQVDDKSEFDFVSDLFALNPDDDEIRKQILTFRLRGLEYAVHEWPWGILYGADGATAAECEELREELAKARELDREHLHTNFFTDFESKLDEYVLRLAASRRSQADTR